MILIVSKYLIPKGFTAIAIWPFVIIKHNKYKSDLVLINHERIHLRQQMELFVFPFFIWYGIEFLLKLILYKNIRKSYLNISFEREAYQNENDFNYIHRRTFYNFLSYL